MKLAGISDELAIMCVNPEFLTATRNPTRPMPYNTFLVNLTLESKTSVILENKLEGELSSELGIEEPSTAYILHNQKQSRRHNWT